MLDELVRNETKGICGDRVNFKGVMNAILNTDENDFKETGISEDYTGIKKKRIVRDMVMLGGTSSERRHGKSTIYHGGGGRSEITSH